MQKRSYSLDLVKTIATAIIVMHHYQVVTGARFQTINFDGGWFYWGYIVELFFLLSGYFMQKYVPVIREGKTTFPEWGARR